MRTWFLAGLIGECLLLLLLALRKRRAQWFALFTLLTVMLCGMAIFFSVTAGQDVTVDKPAQAYMAAQLLRQNQPQAALRALSLVEDDADTDACGVRALRGLAYTQSGAAATAAAYLAGQSDPYAQRVWQVAAAGQTADDALVQQVTDAALGLLALPADTAAGLDAELALRYLENADAAPGQSSDDVFLQVRAALAVGDTPAAFARMLQAADQGNTQQDIVVAEMFARGYDGRGLTGDDAGYAALLDQVTAAQTAMDRAGLALVQARQTGDGAARRQAETDYDLAAARYTASVQSLEQEAVLRAINYLRNAEPGQADRNLAYQWALACLYCRAGQTEQAWQCLDLIYAEGDPAPDRWLGLETALLRQAYLYNSADGASQDWDVLYDQAMAKLYLALLPADPQSTFKGFLQDYFSATLDGLYIGRIDAEAWPVVRVQVATAGLDLNADALTVTELDQPVQNLTLEKLPADELAVCVVLDTGAAMDGATLAAARQALAELLPTLNAPVGLVTFAGSAAVASPLTETTALPAALLGGLVPQGASNLAAGLRAGAEVLAQAQPDARRVILLVTTGTGDSAGTLAPVLRQLQTQQITVTVVAVGEGDTARLQTLPETVGGALFAANSAARVADELARAAQSLRHTYWLQYTAPDPLQTARRVLLQYQENETGLQAQKGYTAGVPAAELPHAWLGHAGAAAADAAEGGL